MSMKLSDGESIANENLS